MAVLATASSLVAAESVADFYRGGTISLIVGSGELASFAAYCVAWHTAPVATIADVRMKESILGGQALSPRAILPAAIDQFAAPG